MISLPLPRYTFLLPRQTCLQVNSNVSARDFKPDLDCQPALVFLSVTVCKRLWRLVARPEGSIFRA